jgi:prepilin-type N-terminal cleavage/methylation domain-containing protein
MRFIGRKGFTLVEILVTIFIFTIILTSITATYSGIFRLLSVNKVKIAALDLADEQIEIIRNLPYAQVGEVESIPTGVIPYSQTIARTGISFTVTTTIRNIHDPFDTTSSSTPDYKIAQVSIGCPSCLNYSPVSLTTYVAPKNLVSATSSGGIYIKAFDANGNPVEQANVQITNSSSTILINDVTNNSGILQEIGLPLGTNIYNISVTKSGYSTDATYAATGGNPTPTKPNITVASEQMSSASFAIDKVSTVNIQTLNDVCAPMGNIGFTVTGVKTIGVNLPKYSSSQTTNSAGLLTLSNLEWDTYNFLISGSTYDLMGSNPILPISLLPNSIQNLQLVLGPKVNSSLLVAVEDSNSNLPLTGANVSISQGATTLTGATGRGFVKQTDWSGGAGQSDMSNMSMYANNDGNIDTTTIPGTLQLRKSGSAYVTSGILESSTFDMGTTTNFQAMLWNPTSQPVQAGTSSVRFQIAVSNVDTATTTWNYVGPGGTATTYFTSANQNINAAENGMRYIRYKAYLGTASTSVTPSISDVEITYTSSCLPPGQAYWNGLSSGTYTVAVNASGYQSSTSTVAVSSTSTKAVILMNAS